MENQFVIAITNKETGEMRFYCNEDYGYWTSSIGHATIYNKLLDAMNTIQSSDFVKESVMSDGTIYPPRMIHSGLRLCNDNMKASGIISICKVEVSPTFFKEMDAEIKIPKNVKYEY